MRKIFAASVVVLMFAFTGCAEVDAGVIKDKLREDGRSEYDCDKKPGSRRSVCEWETTPEKCMFYLDNGKHKGWLEVDCTNEYDAYQVGERYPR